MKPRCIPWLRDTIVADKITVMGEIGAYLIFEKRTDLINQAGALWGDGFEAAEDEPINCEILLPVPVLHLKM
jgi:hypothetical protein